MTYINSMIFPSMQAAIDFKHELYNGTAGYIPISHNFTLLADNVWRLAWTIVV